VTAELGTGPAVSADQWRDKRHPVVDGADRSDGVVRGGADRVGDESVRLAASQVLYWIGPFLVYILLPALDLRYPPPA
jgi:hypothetical protein